MNWKFSSDESDFSDHGNFYVDGWCASLAPLLKPCCKLSFSGFLPSTVPYWN